MRPYLCEYCSYRGAQDIKLSANPCSKRLSRQTTQSFLPSLLCACTIHSNMHYIPSSKTTPPPDWPPTVQISSSNGGGPLLIHSPHKMLHFELLSAVTEGISTEIWPPQHTPSPSLVFIYYFQTAHKEEAAVFQTKRNHAVEWSI